MTILVTGGAGFIGANLVRQLILETDHEIVNLDKLTYAGNLSSLEGVLDHPRHHFVKADINNADAVEAVFKNFCINAVMHLAAESHVDRSIDGPQEFIHTNVMGTYNLLQSSLRHWQAKQGNEHTDFRFLHVSTDEVFGSLKPEEPGFTETTPYKPHSPYSASKAASDHLVRAWHDTYGLPVVVTNCSNNYGPYQFPEKLIPVVILKCLRREPIPVYGKGENVRDWLAVSDHCRALRLVLEKGRVGETYNVGGNNEWSNLELVRKLCQLADELIEPSSPSQNLVTFVTDRPGHDLRYAIDSSKIRTELGWQPLESRENGFRETVSWYLEHRSWWEDILMKKNQGLQRIGTAEKTMANKPS